MRDPEYDKVLELLKAMIKAEGTLQVFVKRNPARDSEYVPEGAHNRRHFDDRDGTVEDYSDSHGLCFKIKFGYREGDDPLLGRTAWFELNEITVIY